MKSKLFMTASAVAFSTLSVFGAASSEYLDVKDKPASSFIDLVSVFEDLPFKSAAAKFSDPKIKANLTPEQNEQLLSIIEEKFKLLPLEEGRSNRYSDSFWGRERAYRIDLHLSETYLKQLMTLPFLEAIHGSRGFYIATEHLPRFEAHLAHLVMQMDYDEGIRAIGYYSFKDEQKNRLGDHFLSQLLGMSFEKAVSKTRSYCLNDEQRLRLDTYFFETLLTMPFHEAIQMQWKIVFKNDELRTRLDEHLFAHLSAMSFEEVVKELYNIPSTLKNRVGDFLFGLLLKMPSDEALKKKSLCSLNQDQQNILQDNHLSRLIGMSIEDACRTKHLLDEAHNDLFETHLVNVIKEMPFSEACNKIDLYRFSPKNKNRLVAYAIDNLILLSFDEFISYRLTGELSFLSIEQQNLLEDCWAQKIVHEIVHEMDIHGIISSLNKSLFIPSIRTELSNHLKTYITSTNDHALARTYMTAAFALTDEAKQAIQAYLDAKN